MRLRTSRIACGEKEVGNKGTVGAMTKTSESLGDERTATALMLVRGRVSSRTIFWVAKFWRLAGIGCLICMQDIAGQSSWSRLSGQSGIWNQF